jgi:diadenylate cyclase
MSFDRLQSLLHRLLSYPLWQVAIELGLIALVVYVILRFVRGTRAAGALKGMFVVLAFLTIAARIIGAGEAFQRLAYLYDRFLAIFAVALVVIFQPELRRALIRLGENPFLRSTQSEIAVAADAIAEACLYLSKSRFGALIVIQREIGLKGIVEGGTLLGAELTSRLLQTIFFPGSALHDLAVIVKGNVIHAAGVQLPLAEPADMPDPRLGSRHRAAVGLSKNAMPWWSWSPRRRAPSAWQSAAGFLIPSRPHASETRSCSASRPSRRPATRRPPKKLPSRA